MNSKPKILIVDDEERNLRLMEALLLPEGYDLLIAHDGQEALEKVKVASLDLILLDVMMPNMDGFEVAQRLKGEDTTRLIPIIMVTSLNAVEDRVKALDVGADDFLSKPVEKNELRARVHSLLRVKAYYDHLKNYQQELEEKVAEQTKKIRDAALETILRLSRAAEYRDDDTGTHILRMSHYAVAVACQIGQSEREVEMLRHAAPMHDVGKIGVPDHILLKPGKLTPDEWKIMKQHTIIGGEILADSDSELIQLARVIALTHHEKWDGNGYPNGLKGAQIPLVGRVTAIADAFDALTTERPYKKAFPVEKAESILRTDRGTHFDPAVVDAFFEAETEILVIKEKFGGLFTPETQRTTDRFAAFSGRSESINLSSQVGRLKFLTWQATQVSNLAGNPSF